MTDQPLVSPEGISRDDLYNNWLVWVTNNLGDDAALAAVAANAAADTAVKGEGFNAAAEAARSAWVDAAPADKQLWRPGFWPLLLTSWYFWILVVSLIAAPLIYITALVALVMLPIVGWQAYNFWRLAKRGTVVPGSLFNVKDPPRIYIRGGRGGGRESYIATYQFDSHGQHFTTHDYYSKDSIRQDVLILFDPKHPSNAMVMPELLNPGA
jgi:hypothetical protein